MLHSKSIQMQKIFDEQVVGKLKEDRNQLMNAGPSDHNSEINSHASIDELRSRQKQMLGGNLSMVTLQHTLNITYLMVLKISFLKNKHDK